MFTDISAHTNSPLQAVMHFQRRTQTQRENEQSLKNSADSKLVQTATITHIWCLRDARRNLPNTEQDSMLSEKHLIESGIITIFE